MKRTPFCVTAILMVAGAMPFQVASGQNGYARRGTVELGGSAGFSSTSIIDSDADAITMVDISPYLGYFVADGFEIGVNPFTINIISQGDNSLTEILVLFSAAYNFETKDAAYPFVEGLIGFSSLSNGASSSGVAWGGRGGVKVGIAEHALLNIALQFTQQNLDDSGFNVFSISAGFSVWVP
jgi:hypothetical protein